MLCSFDVVHDSLGLVRTEFPHTIYCVTGTQVSLIVSNQTSYITTSSFVIVVDVIIYVVNKV